MLGPIPLPLGARVTIALRALRPAGPGRRGARNTACPPALARGTGSDFAVRHAAADLSSLYGLCFTTLFTDLMRTGWALTSVRVGSACR